jgi:anthranilate phosphoribosyltransferase
MSVQFREFVKKIGSGNQTGKDLSRSEAKQAMQMLLEQNATPAQIGAFLIAHRIKRPTAEELAGMLDGWEQFSYSLPSLSLPAPLVVLGSPYDGRARHSPISPVTGLILAVAGFPVLLHGSDRLPTKYGLPLIDLWRELGMPWHSLSPDQVHTILQQTNLGFAYMPKFCPAFHALVPYREEIGKRPPLATLELIWSPYRGKQILLSGFVHPPTEVVMTETFALRGIDHYATIRGLEGSVDLPIARVSVIGRHLPATGWQRITLHARNYELGGDDPKLTTAEAIAQEIRATLEGKMSDYTKAAVWNGAIALWLCGKCPDLETGIATVQDYLKQGLVADKLAQISQLVRQIN